MKPIPALCQKTVTELCALLDGGQITSVEIVQAYLRAIDARDGEVHAYLETYPDDALREAAESDRRRAQGRRLSPTGWRAHRREGQSGHARARVLLCKPHAGILPLAL